MLTSSKEQRVFRTTTGEKAPFWVTAWLWTRADGQCFIPPSLVYQGSQLSEFHALGLPSDWIVHATPSGYQDHDGFLKVCTQFLEYCGPKRPQYVYMDGHDSHFDSEALDLLASNHVFVFFLKSNNSEENQPNDNGPNSALKALYDLHYDDWLHQYDGIPYNGAFFNTVFVPAWRGWKVKASGAISRAFEKCGIWPLNEDATNYVHGNDQLSAKFGGSTSRSAQHSSGETPTSSSLVDSEAPSEVGFLRSWKGNEFTLLRAKAAAPERSLLIRSAAHDYFKTSTVVPAQHLQGILIEQELAKKKRIDSSASRAQLGNPGARSGLYASEAVRKRCREVEEARPSDWLKKDLLKRNQKGPNAKSPLLKMSWGRSLEVN